MKIEDLLSSIEEIILLIAFYLSRGGNIHRAIRDLAETSVDYRKLSFISRHSLLYRLSSSLFSEEEKQLAKILFSATISRKGVEEYPIRILEEKRLHFNTYLEKLESFLIFFTALAAFTPIILSLMSFFGIISYYVASLILASLMILLNMFLTKKIHSRSLDLKTLILASLISIIGSTTLFFYYKSLRIHAFLAVILMTILYLYLKRKNSRNLFQKVLDENLTYERLLLWTIEHMKQGESFETSLKKFTENEAANYSLIKWLFHKRHSLNAPNPLLDSVEILLTNSGWSYGAKQLRNLVYILRKVRIMLKELYEKIRVLKYKSDIICYISSAATALIFALLFIFKKINEGIIIFLASYIFSFFIFSLNLDLFQHRRSEALKKIISFMLLSISIGFVLDLIGFPSRNNAFLIFLSSHYWRI